MNELNKKNLVLMLASLANGISFSMILPLLAPLIRQLKMSEFQAGLLVSASALLMSLSAMWISKRSQMIDQYRLLRIGFIGMTLTWGLFAGALSYGINYSVAVGALFALLLLTRASTGIFMAMPQIALQSHVMTTFHTEKQRSQMMAKFGALNSLGLVFGPFLTTILILYGILIPMWLAVLLLALMSVLVILLFPKQAQHADGTDSQEILNKSKNHLQKNSEPIDHIIENNQHNLDIEKNNIIKKSIIWLVLGFSLYVAIVTLNLTAGFYIQDKFQLSIQQSAIYFSQCSLIVGITLVLMQVAISKWLQWSLSTLLFVGLFSMLIGLMISIATDQIIIFQLAYIFYGVAVACLMPAFTTGASQSVSMHFQTKIAALCTMVQALSLVIAPLMSTGLYQIKIVLPYYLLMLIFSFLLVYFIVKKGVQAKSKMLEA